MLLADVAHADGSRIVNFWSFALIFEDMTREMPREDNVGRGCAYGAGGGRETGRRAKNS